MPPVMVLLVKCCPNRLWNLPSYIQDGALLECLWHSNCEVFESCFGTECNQYSWSTGKCTLSLKSLMSSLTVQDQGEAILNFRYQTKIL